jgi:hypothetical protein
VSLADELESLAAAVTQAVAGKEATLRDRDGAEIVVIAVMVSYPRGDQIIEDVGETADRTCEITFQRSDIDDPARWQLATFGGETWSLRWPPQVETEQMVTYVAKRRTAVERSRPNYRGSR